MRRKGDCFGCTLAAVLAYSVTGNGMKLGAVRLGFFGKCAIIYESGGLRGTIKFHFWESHSILLDFVEPIRAQGKKKKANQKVFNKRKKCFHIQLSHNTAIM